MKNLPSHAPAAAATSTDTGTEEATGRAPGEAPGSHEFGNRQRHLYNHLVKRAAPLVSIPFHDFAEIVGTALPPSAFRDAAFWEQPEGAAPSPWAMAWRKAGYEIDTFRLARDGGWVRFKRSA